MIPLIPHLDIMTEAIGTTEIAQIKDDGNPVLEKKKKKVGEPSTLDTFLSADVPTASKRGDSSKAAGHVPSSSTACTTPIS